MAKQRQLEEYKATYAQQVLDDDDDESLFFVYEMFADSINTIRLQSAKYIATICVTFAPLRLNYTC